jgi:uncharacterized membrane protein YuzA (DUF378 family)
MDELLMTKIKENYDRNNLLNDHLIDMGYGSFNVITNLGGLVFSLVFYIIISLFGAMIISIKACFDKAYPKYKKEAKRIIKVDDYQEEINKKYRNLEIKLLARKAVKDRRRSREV